MRFTRYAWSLLLLVAAILSPNVATAVTLVVAGLITITLALLREKKLRHLVQELDDLLSLKRAGSNTALERALHRMQRSTLTLTVVAEAIIFICLLVGSLDITVARNYALLVLIALAPLGLELELAVLLRLPHTRNSETVRTAVGFAQEDAWTLLSVIGLSFIGTLWLHIPPALSALQILLITCVIRPLLSGRSLQAMPHKTDRVWRVMFAAVVVYGNFVFYFIRHYLEPRYADASTTVVWQASSVALVTFVGCQAVLMLLLAPLVKNIAYRSGLTLLAVGAALTMHHYFASASLGASDWAATVIACLFFAAVILLVAKVRSRGEH